MQETEGVPSIGDIIEATAAHFDTSVEELAGSARTQTHCIRRAVAYHLCAELTEAPLATIGAAFGRDHSAVARGLERPLDYTGTCAIDFLRASLTRRTAHYPAYVKRWPFRSRRPPSRPMFFQRHTA